MDTPIELLVFSAQGMLFGAYAGHVAEVVHAEEQYTLSENGCFSWVYRDTEYQGIDFRYWLNQHTASQNSVSQIECARPSKLLLITSWNCPYQAVWVDDVEQFLTVSVDCLHTLPVFMQKIRHGSALWGIVCHENSMILLIDLFKLLDKNQRRC